MANGERRFRAAHPTKAQKIDDDPHVAGADRLSFWAGVDRCAAGSDIDRHAEKCCQAKQFRGPRIELDDGESLGTAQPIKRTASDLATQIMPGRSVPPPTTSEAETYLAAVMAEPSREAGLALLTSRFPDAYLRAFRYGSKTRIFAFRNPESPEEPTRVTSYVRLFERLAIHDAAPRDYFFVEFTPAWNSRKKTPTAFDAGAHLPNLETFVPGGVTAPTTGDGLPELITPPPKLGYLKSPPRRIT